MVIKLLFVFIGVLIGVTLTYLVLSKLAQVYQQGKNSKK